MSPDPPDDEMLTIPVVLFSPGTCKTKSLFGENQTNVRLSRLFECKSPKVNVTYMHLILDIQKN